MRTGRGPKDPYPRLMGSGSAGSGKQISLGLLNPEALQGPPGGPVWRRPLLALVMGIAVVAAALFVTEAFRDGPARFETWHREVRCPFINTGEGTLCFEIDILNTGSSPARARCTWGDGWFTTPVVGENSRITRNILDHHSTGDPRIACRPV